MITQGAIKFLYNTKNSGVRRSSLEDMPETPVKYQQKADRPYTNYEEAGEEQKMSHLEIRIWRSISDLHASN